jgi:hypothetical protein
MPSLFATQSCSFPIIVRRQLLPVIVDQCHCHPLPSSSAEVAISRHSHHRQSAVSAFSCCSLLSPYSLVGVSFLPHCPLPPALACRRQSTPSSSTAITVHGSCRKPPQSLLPICCLHHLSLLSLVAIVSHQQLLTFQFILHRCCRRHHHHRRFLLAVDIITIYCLPLLRLLLLVPSLVSCRALSCYLLKN